jgi:hypothetical protein
MTVLLISLLGIGAIAFFFAWIDCFEASATCVIICMGIAVIVIYYIGSGGYTKELEAREGKKQEVSMQVITKATVDDIPFIIGKNADAIMVSDDMNSITIKYDEKTTTYVGHSFSYTMEPK